MKLSSHLRIVMGNPDDLTLASEEDKKKPAVGFYTRTYVKNNLSDFRRDTSVITFNSNKQYRNVFDFGGTSNGDKISSIKNSSTGYDSSFKTTYRFCTEFLILGVHLNKKDGRLIEKLCGLYESVHDGHPLNKVKGIDHLRTP
ncbi:MAG: hypothetical protein EOO92_14940 [Pedobacter sp.]|nr:MAG: hypothetical protein EOO92_14940 [Pedobacter sp.]